MILVLHISFALLALALSGAAALRPGKRIIPAASIAIAGTLVSGIALTVMQPATLLRTCILGTLFLGVSVLLVRQALRQQSASVRPA
jgi:hypothetical protein